MSSDSKPRLVIAAVFLSFQTLLFAFQIIINQKLLFPTRDHVKKWLVVFQYLISPLFIGILGIAFTLVMFNDNFVEDIEADQRELQPLTCSNYAVRRINITSIDTEIAGPGIVIAQWAQLAVLFTFALLGTLHTDATGVKEIGAALAVIHLSLAIALLVQYRAALHKDGGYSTTNAILGAMVLDSQSSAISIQMITKETLASRFQVLAVLPCQFFGIAVEAVLVRHFHYHLSGQEYDECSCLVVTWWGRLSSCDGPTPMLLSGEMTIFWTYFACRVVALIQSSYHALMDTNKFHYAEIASRKREPKSGSTSSIVSKGDLTDTTFVSPLASSDPSPLNKFLRWVTREEKRGADYNDWPTTMSLAYIINGVFSVASMVAVRTAINTKGKVGPMNAVEWTTGQVIAVVVAAVTIVRGLWHFARILRKPKELKPLPQLFKPL